MSYASEKLRKGYLRRKMAVIVSNVKVKEIIVRLPCLTDHDRDTIEAKTETRGNFDGMVLLLDCLKRRENWPEQLIEALEACEHPTLAAEIRAEYNALRGINDSNPSPPSSIVNAHVHPPPSATELPVPQGAEKSTSNVAPSPEPVSPPKNPVRPQADQSPAAQFTGAASLPESVPPESTDIEAAPLPSTPPPSPETQRAPVATPVPPQRELKVHQEPEENSDSDIQDITGGTGIIPEQVETGTSMISSVVPAPPSCPVEHSKTDALPCSEPLQTITEVKPPQSPPPPQKQPSVNDQSAFLTRTPEKGPVQDTTPPVGGVPGTVLEPEQTSESNTAKVVESSKQTKIAGSASTLPAATGVDFLLADDVTGYLSKPEQLISYQPQNVGSPNIPAVVEPYSGNSERLLISDGAPDPTASACNLAWSDITSTITDTGSGVPCQDYGITLNHNEPEENHYESPSRSLETQEVREHVMHVSNEVSILNLEGQTPAPQAQMFNSGTSASSTIKADTVNAHSRENYRPSYPAPSNTSSQLPDPEEKEVSCMTKNTKYIVMAAGVGAFALLVAWKLRN
ncbi:mitochondrial antiviral-signaling protein [Betta splendens]|uniref:Mitochondrial antiviral-signaling protein n=1 Tax=Betta splendens TaxID=158456 RepID=A0A6P7LJN5_BETSP|nr:mitochondrial antiviral-signaling protein [Betta splendens]XP_055361673.1 mitochondrial antiviral-signaling protein [Betta splendens]